MFLSKARRLTFEEEPLLKQGMHSLANRKVKPPSASPLLSAPSNRRARSPCPRPTPLSLSKVLATPPSVLAKGPNEQRDAPSSFFSSSLGASSVGPVVPPPVVVGAAAAPPPEPTFVRMSLTFLPSRACHFSLRLSKCFGGFGGAKEFCETKV